MLNRVLQHCPNKAMGYRRLVHSGPKHSLVLLPPQPFFSVWRYKVLQKPSLVGNLLSHPLVSSPNYQHRSLSLLSSSSTVFGPRGNSIHGLKTSLSL